MPRRPQETYWMLNVPRGDRATIDRFKEIIFEKRAKIIIMPTERISVPELIYDDGIIYGERDIEEFLKEL